VHPWPSRLLSTDLTVLLLCIVLSLSLSLQIDFLVIIYFLGLEGKFNEVRNSFVIVLITELQCLERACHTLDTCYGYCVVCLPKVHVWEAFMCGDIKKLWGSDHWGHCVLKGLMQVSWIELVPARVGCYERTRLVPPCCLPSCLSMGLSFFCHDAICTWCRPGCPHWMSRYWLHALEPLKLWAILFIKYLASSIFSQHWKMD
jgi:hypothetical protein